MGFCVSACRSIVSKRGGSKEGNKWRTPHSSPLGVASSRCFVFFLVFSRSSALFEVFSWWGYPFDITGYWVFSRLFSGGGTDILYFVFLVASRKFNLRFVVWSLSKKSLGKGFRRLTWKRLWIPRVFIGSDSWRWTSTSLIFSIFVNSPQYLGLSSRLPLPF